MPRPRVEQRRRRRTETSALVEIVEFDRPNLPVLGFGMEKPHGHSHPEELRGLKTAGHLRLLVHDQIPVVQRLDPQEVQFQVSQRIQGRCHLVQIVFLKIRAVALDFRSPLDGVPELLAVKIPQGSHPVPQDVPSQHLLINERKLDPAGKLSEICILLDVLLL